MIANFKEMDKQIPFDFNIQHSFGKNTKFVVYVSSPTCSLASIIEHNDEQFIIVNLEGLENDAEKFYIRNIDKVNKQHKLNALKATL